jgi:hypothetical protein
MSTRPLIHHPLDPAHLKFDFLSWRVLRRYAAAQIFAIADTMTGDREALVLECGNALSEERLGREHLAALNQVLTEHGEPTPANLNDLVLGLSAIVRRISAVRRPPEGLADISPDWSRIPMMRTHFAGTVCGVQAEARLPAGHALIPPYEVAWIVGGRELTVSVGSAEFTSPDAAPTVWDWLFARRLTLLCLAGAAEWPDTATPPLHLGEDWPKLARPF